MKRTLAHPFAPQIVLTLATIVWGASFLITRNAVQGVAPLAFVALRFATAAAVVAGVTRPRLIRLTRTEVRAGFRLALAMFGGYGLQAIGMTLGVTSGRAAFISALYVPIVPILQLILLRRRPRLATWAGFGLAFAGLALMAGPFGPSGAGRGDILVLTAALCIAAEILLLGTFAARVDPRRLAVVECTLLALLCLVGTPVLGEKFSPLAPGWMLGALLLGIASAGLQISVNWAQRQVSPTRATLIYAMEPVWAAFFGMLAGEHMGPGAMAGAACILVSLVLSSL